MGAGEFGKKISNNGLVPFSLLNIKNSIPLETNLICSKMMRKFTVAGKSSYGNSNGLSHWLYQQYTRRKKCRLLTGAFSLKVKGYHLLVFSERLTEIM